MDAPTTPAAPEPDARSAFRPTRLTSGIVAGAAALAMVLAGLGIASAQTAESTPTAPPPASTEGDPGAAGEPEPQRRHRHPVAKPARIAALLGITVEELEAQRAEGKTIAAIAGDRTDEVVAALVAEATERLDAAVAAERLSAEEAAAKKAGLEERFTALVNRTPPAGGERGPKHGGPGHRGAKTGLSLAASTLGISEEELRTQLRAGRSLASIAGDRTPALIDALVAEAQARMDRAVAEGKLTPEQAAQRKANLTERITARLNATPRPGGGA